MSMAKRHDHPTADLSSVKKTVSADHTVSRSEIVIRSVISLLANQHIESELEMYLNVDVISVKVQLYAMSVNLNFSFWPRFYFFKLTLLQYVQ